MKKIKLLIVAAGILVFNSCKKEGCTDPAALNYSDKAKTDNGTCQYDETQETGKVTLDLEHYWVNENTDFSLNTQYVHPQTGDSLTFTTFKYFVSNIRLKKEDGTWWTQPESYYLVNLDETGSAQLVIPGVPTGNYTGISYIMGVDSTRNVSGAQTGALSTTSGMFWSWNTGYIMVKAEGTSPQAGMGGAFTYHLGGFSGNNNIVTAKIAAFGTESLDVTTTSTGMIHLGVDPSKLFTTTGSVSNVGMIHMPGQNAVTMATDFYTSGVSFKYIHN